MIEVVSKNNIEEVLPLIKAYQAFYKVTEISDAKNLAFFSQFGESDAKGCQFLFREKDKVAGFATVYFSFTSTIAEKVAVLNDVFVLDDYRGKGIARQLIEHCRAYASEMGAARLQWLTALDNEPANRLYESMNTNKSTWNFYTYSV